jgi:tRNA (guanine-N7-)-methyltransferase
MYEYFRQAFLTSRQFCSGTVETLFEAFPVRVVEIGFGNGDFLAYLTKSLGERTLVLGLEVSAVCALKAVRRLAHLDPGNVRVILGDARYVLENCLPDGSISTIYMNFPCPWPKKRHSSRRVTHGRFSESLSRVLKTGGEFRLVTDEEWYAIEVKEGFSSNPSLEFASFEIDPVLELTTKYASKWKAMGKSSYRLTIRKTREEQKTHPVKMEGNMTMHCKLSLAEPALSKNQAERLIGRKGSQGAFHWSFKSIYWSSDGHALLKTITSDEGFEQTFFFRLVFAEAGLLIKLEDAGAPLHTPSVRLAMDSLAEYFKEKP